MTTEIRTLLSLITTQIDIIETKYKNSNQPFPALSSSDAPIFGPLDQDPEVDAAKDIAVAALVQLLANIKPPFDTVYEMASGTLQTAALGFVEEVNIPNILAEAGSEVCSLYCRTLTTCLLGILGSPC